MSFHPYQPPVWNDPCLICSDGADQPKGFLVYRYDQLRCSWFILLAYTLPAHRRLGVHSALFNALVERGRQRGDILAIDSGTHVLNKAAQAAFEAQGRKQVALQYEFRLRDWLEGASHLDVPTAVASASAQSEDSVHV
ncbi:GNAT family N-acetyltransferase [Rhizobium leguminosarum]|nr:GNAT family N-acetyltransferase [Rhizobium leguminosarum]